MKGRPPSRSQPWRWLLAALTLLAAAAFQGRALGEPLLPRPAHGSAHQHHAPPEGARPGPAADHAAHCLFCLTGAFALRPQPLRLPAAPGWLVSSAPSEAPRADFFRPRAADARAPPRPA